MSRKKNLTQNDIAIHERMIAHAFPPAPTVKAAVKLEGNEAEEYRALKIAQRAHALFNSCSVQQFAMDILATHLNGCPLDLGELLEADQFEFLHDVLGIRRHLDRATGKLNDFFTPRYSARYSATVGTESGGRS